MAKVLEFQLSVTKSCTTLYDPMGCSMLGLPIPQCLPEFVQSVIFFSCLQPFPASGSFPMSWLFALDGHSIGASASASVLPMNIQGCPPFRIDWFDLLAVEGTLKSLLQHHNSKTSILQGSAFFRVQFSHPYMTTKS